MSVIVTTGPFPVFVQRSLANERDAWIDLVALYTEPLEKFTVHQLFHYQLRGLYRVDEVLAYVWYALPDHTKGRLRAYAVREQERHAPVDPDSLERYLQRMVKSRLRCLVRAEDRRQAHEKRAARPPEEPVHISYECGIEAVVKLMGESTRRQCQALWILVMDDPHDIPGTTITPGNLRVLRCRLMKKLRTLIDQGRLGWNLF